MKNYKETNENNIKNKNKLSDISDHVAKFIHIIKTHFMIVFLSPHKESTLGGSKNTKQRGNSYRGKALTNERREYLIKLSNRALD